MTGLDPVGLAELVESTAISKAGAVEMTRGGKLKPPSFPPTLGNPAQSAGFPHFHSPDD